MFNQQLMQANKQQQANLPQNIKKVEDLSAFDVTAIPDEEFMELDKKDLFGEFSYKNKHYHYMKISDGLLLMDVTEQSVVKRGTNDILVILLVLFIPCMAACIYIGKTISTHALKPFHRLSQHFQQKEDQQTQPEKLIDIEEQDVRIIAQRLEQALTKQALLIEEQVAFNQGMSHEIRTPLQVMSHSLELIETNHCELYHQPLMQRLVKSLSRIKRTSNALLWLTAKDPYKNENCVNKGLDKILLESKDLVTAHQLDITLSNINQYQPKISMPEEVLELIFFNLINNVIHHGMQNKGIITLTISIDKHGITFSNETANTSSEQQHFSIGLRLIKKLADRFNSDFTTNLTSNKFNANLSFN
jgi:signal transduction histidine kinase